MIAVRYLSICSGIESASVAWHPLGWTAEAFAEIEPFACAVLRAHYPHIENYGAIETFETWPRRSIDVLAGGTPCQSFSVAGLRGGMGDPRGNLALVYLAIADRFRPRWLVYENVPGLLSADDGSAMGSFLGGLGELGYGFAWRVFDAQYFGLAQRRKRLFVVGYFGDWRPALSVLFEYASLRGDPAPCRETRQGDRGSAQGRVDRGGLGEIAGTLGGLSAIGGGFRTTDLDQSGAFVPEVIATTGEISFALNAGAMHRIDYETETLIACAEVADPVAANQSNTYTREGSKNFRLSNVALESSSPADGARMRVRRLTPRECERLQGFPDDYTLIRYRGKPAKDGPRYRALGNAMPVPVMRWIGQRITLIESLKGIQCSPLPR